MISVGSLIFGIGRSSMATLYGPLKMTAFMVSLDMLEKGGDFNRWGFAATTQQFCVLRQINFHE